MFHISSIYFNKKLKFYNVHFIDDYCCSFPSTWYQKRKKKTQRICMIIALQWFSSLLTNKDLRFLMQKISCHKEKKYIYIHDIDCLTWRYLPAVVRLIIISVHHSFNILIPKYSIILIKHTKNSKINNSKELTPNHHSLNWNFKN